MTPTALLRRLVLVVPTLFGVAVVVFVLLRVVPGDPIAMMIPPGAGEADIARLRAQYGLDQPIPAQLVAWFGDMLGGNFGRSIVLRQSVLSLVLSRLPATLELVTLAVLIAGVLGFALAWSGAWFRRRLPEALVDAAIGFLLAVPDFLWALLFILVFGVLLPVLPISGRIDPRLATPFATGFYGAESLLTLRLHDFADLTRHALLPATALALPFAAVLARVLKAGLAEAERRDYAQLARARGFSRGRVLLREALPNAAVPTVALAGVQVTFMLGGTVLVERVFSYQGIGNMAVDAVTGRDLPLIQGVVLAFAVLFIAANLAVDVFVRMLDPRLRDA